MAWPIAPESGTQKWTRFSGIALPEFGPYSKWTHVWMELSLLCKLLIKTIWCRQKNDDVTSGSMSTIPLPGKVDFCREGVKGQFGKGDL